MRAPRGFKAPQSCIDEYGDVPFCQQNLKTIYGRRPAAARWQDLASNDLTKAGFKRGINDPTIFFNKDTKEVFRLHGGDFEGAGPAGALQVSTDMLAKTLIIKTSPSIASGDSYNCMRVTK
eukprot:5355792-Alexandrium_andersonii.AAC.1